MMEMHDDTPPIYQLRLMLHCNNVDTSRNWPRILNSAPCYRCNSMDFYAVYRLPNRNWFRMTEKIQSLCVLL